MIFELDRRVGEESSRTYNSKVKNGFFAKYMSGNGLEIGYKGYIDGVVPITKDTIGIELGYPGYDGVHLPFPDNSQNFVYSSHCLEHIKDYVASIQEWYRVVKVGGYVVIVVPHQFLYEKKASLPSNWNRDHQRFYTPASLLKEIEASLTPNTYRVRYLKDNDEGYSYSIPPENHAHGPYELELVIEKINKPTWDIK